MAVNNYLDCSIISVDNISGTQQIIVLLMYNKINILLGCVDIPPSTYRDIYKKYCEIVENIIRNYCIVNVLIIGDFSLSDFPWSDYSLYNNPIVNVLIQSYLYYLDLKS